jgi:5,5'-dehydrodivanillate O-demethylase oxygenase subunit
VLTAEKNRILTEVSPGTPMGNLLRRYWHPVAGVSELDERPIKAVRLFGEELVLYKDLSGQFGLIERSCPHRRADLSYGFVEPAGIRCSYHGWLMNHEGKCIEQPFEDVANPGTRFKDRCGTTAYPVRPLAGMLWAYMGPAPAPELPVWEPFTWANGFVEVVRCEVPCNWLQCQENSCDPVHFEWMHENATARARGDLGNLAPKHLKLGFEEFEFGFTYKRIREGNDESDPLWTTGRVTLWPNGFYLGDHFEWRVPIDDETTLSISWYFSRVPKEREPYTQERILTWVAPVKDAQGRWISSHVINQDIVAWVGQGRIADRTREHLGSSDRGITMMRKRLFEDLEAIAAGKDPLAILRDPERAKCVPLPIATPKAYIDGMSRQEWLEHPFFSQRLKEFRWHAGQPDAVWNEYIEAMGFPERKR